MRNSADNMRGIRDRTAEILVGIPEVQEWEISVLHRLYETRSGACARVIWTKGDPEATDRMISGFRTDLLPRLEQLPGFCSCSMLVDRQSGACSLTAVYTDRSAMDASREEVMDMRETFRREMGMEVTEVAEFDLVLHHLRVPELV